MWRLLSSIRSGSEHNMADYQQHPVQEERTIHAAADAAVQDFGIADYLSRMAVIGAAGCAPLEQLKPAERLLADHAADKLRRLFALHR